MRDVISLIDAQLLKVAAPETSLAKLEVFVDPMRRACKRFNIDTVREVACFLAQGAHESSGFTDFDENLSYSAKRLTEVWPKRFPNLKAAQPYANNPEALANKVYANRLGNGDEASGDGYRHRGAGIFQLTGRLNQRLCAKALGVPFEQFPDYIRTPEGAVMTAAWYFYENDLDRYAATPGVEDDTLAINGGQHGLADRRTRFNAVVKELLERGA